MSHRKALRTSVTVLLALGTLWGLMVLLGGSRMPPAWAQGSGTVRYVATTGSDTGNDCTNPANPCRTIQHAVDVAEAGDEIRVAAGTYSDLHTRPAPAGYIGVANGGMITQVLYITRSLTIRGGYSTGQWNAADPQASPTILDARRKGRVVVIAREAGAVTPTVTVEGVRIIAGRTISTGGGIYILSATTTLRDNVIFNNVAVEGTGGGVWMFSSHNSSLLNNEIYSNSAQTGGGIGALSCPTLTLQSNKVHDNEADNGGGMFLGLNSSFYLHDNDIYANRAISTTGGGVDILAMSTYVSATHNLIHDNQAKTTGGGVNVGAIAGYADFLGDHIYANQAITGGGVYASMGLGSVDLVDVRLHDNQAQQSGGGVYLLGSLASSAITNTHVYSNLAGWDGGGMFLNLSLGGASLFGNYLYGNQAGRDGGGLFASLGGGSFDSINDVFAGNRATRAGSGVLLSSGGGDTFRIKHATLARNTGGDGSGIHVALTSTVQVSNTVIVSHTVGVTVAQGSKATLQNTLWSSGTTWANATNWAGDGTINTIADYGGDPAFVAPDLYDYHIQAGSAAKDKGMNAGVATDIDGQPRDASPDLGADEYPASCTPPASVAVSGPTTVTVGTASTFTATVNPTDTTPALTYLWERTGASPLLHPNSLLTTDTARLTWNAAGTQRVTVTVYNPCGTAQASREVAVEESRQKYIYLYLPLVLRNR